jgi:CheY-like chemotaxis protein
VRETISEREHIELIALLDIGLPGMNGYEHARQLRQRPGSATMRLVAVTGYCQKADVEFALQAALTNIWSSPSNLSSSRRY